MMSNEILKLLEESLTECPWSDDLPGNTWRIAEADDWGDEGKWQSKTDVVQHIESGRYFSVSFSRTGDHWQGYETEFTGAGEVEPYEVTVTHYRAVKEVTND